MSFATVAAAVEATGLRLVGCFHPAADDRVPEGIATLLLLGPADAAMWQAFRAAPEFSDGRPDPLDRWSRRLVEGLASKLGGVAFLPFGGPPWHPFQRWAARGEGAVVSPVVMQAAPRRGLWASYRGALGFAARLSLPPRPLADPCRGCPAPCLAACPVAAFRTGAYDVAGCVAHVQGEEGFACRTGCLVRASCPAGAALGLPREQRAFHMAAFLAAQAPATDPQE
jgi:epoxyqueuosine reductase